MPQQPVELILVKQLASALSTPISIVDAEGRFLYFNEAAELVFGCPLDEIGDLEVGDLSQRFSVQDEEGRPIPTEQMLFAIALREDRPAHRTFVLRGLDGVARRITATAFPLIGQGGHRLGAAAFLWEDKDTACK